MSNKKQTQADKVDGSLRDGKNKEPDKIPNELPMPIGPDQGFVYYEE